MKPAGQKGWTAGQRSIGLCSLCLAGLLLANNAAIAQEPGTGLGKATDFSSDEYFGPPNEQKVKMRLSGAAADPLPGGALAIKQLKIETFNLDGKAESVVRAPECIYLPYDGIASSSGPLELQTGDGRVTITGEGFLWRQTDQTLTISNNVHTLMTQRTN